VAIQYNDFMKRFILGLLIMIVLAACSSPVSTLDSQATPNYPFPQHLTYAPNTIRPNHFTQAEQDQDVKTFYNRWKRNYVVRTTQIVDDITLYRIAFSKSSTSNYATTVSEGQGYGMMIVALMAGHDPNAQTIFDGLWKFSRVNFSRIDSRLMRWKIPAPVRDQNSAFDGDADMAYALLLADKQWGSNGHINYLKEAKTVIQAIRESTIGPISKLPRLGDWTRDLPDSSNYDQYSPRSSDFMPAHFRAYGRATGTGGFWNQVISKTQYVTNTIQTNYSPSTGLLPDFITGTCAVKEFCPAPDGFLEGPNDDSYSWNAGRVPMRLGTDALINNNSVSRTQVRKISLWIKQKSLSSPANIKAGYELNGNPVANSDYFSTFFAAPLGVAAMLVPSQQVWLNSIYDSVRTKSQDYYADSVTLLCLLIMTGNYWDPTLR
jgi:endo-1,4-beta-D-glucanase Y